MTVNDPAIIQELIICSPKKLKDVAKRHGMAVSRASVVRDHWVRRITGHCVQCNILVKGDVCTQCKTTKQSATEFLQKIKQKDVALRRYCTHCGVPFYYSAGYILSSFKKSGVFKPSNACERCRAPRAQSSRPKKRKPASKKVKPIKAKKPPASKKPAPKKEAPNLKGEKPTPKPVRKNKEDASLTHRPFAALEALKLKNEG